MLIAYRYCTFSHAFRGLLYNPEFPITVSLVAVLAAVSLLLVIGEKKLIVERTRA